jgi:hypothetical protein
VDFEEEA